MKKALKMAIVALACHGKITDASAAWLLWKLGLKEA